MKEKAEFTGKDLEVYINNIKVENRKNVTWTIPVETLSNTEEIAKEHWFQFELDKLKANGFPTEDKLKKVRNRIGKWEIVEWSRFKP